MGLSRGLHVLVGSRDLSKGKMAAAATSHGAEAVRLDVSKDAFGPEAFKDIAGRFGSSMCS